MTSVRALAGILWRGARRSHPDRTNLRPIVPARILAFSTAAWIAVACQQPAAVEQPQSPGTRQVSEYVRRVFGDSAGQLWLGTNSDGVARYDGESLTWFGAAQGFPGQALRAIVEHPDGSLWFAHDAGVSRYEQGVFTNYTQAHGLSAPDCWSLCCDREGVIWVGTLAGVCRLAGDRFVPFAIPAVEVEAPQSRFSPKLALDIAEDREGKLWFGTDGEGVTSWDGQRFTAFTTENGLCSNQIWCVLGDRQGRVWVGGDGGGVSCFERGALRNFGALDGLPSDRVWSAFEDRAGRIWFGTLGGGACCYDGESFATYRETGGLTRNHVQGIGQSADGALWFGVSGGLFRLAGQQLVNVTREGPWR